MTFSTAANCSILSSPGIIYGRVWAVSSRVHVDLDKLDIPITSSPSTNTDIIHPQFTQSLAAAYTELTARISSTSHTSTPAHLPIYPSTSGQLSTPSSLKVSESPPSARKC